MSLSARMAHTIHKALYLMRYGLRKDISHEVPLYGEELEKMKELEYSGSVTLEINIMVMRKPHLR